MFLAHFKMAVHNFNRCVAVNLLFLLAEFLAEWFFMVRSYCQTFDVRWNWSVVEQTLKHVWVIVLFTSYLPLVVSIYLLLFIIKFLLLNSDISSWAQCTSILNGHTIRQCCKINVGQLPKLFLAFLLRPNIMTRKISYFFAWIEIPRLQCQVTMLDRLEFFVYFFDAYLSVVQC